MAKHTQVLADKIYLAIPEQILLMQKQREKCCYCLRKNTQISHSRYMVAILKVVMLMCETMMFLCFSTSCSFGTITLTEAVIKITKKEDLSEFKEKSFSFYLF
jgi:hypothetical protein